MSFREKLARQDATSGGDRSRSSFLVDVRIGLTPRFVGPVQLARVPNEQGRGLAEAHSAVSEPANRRSVTVRLPDDDLEKAIERIGALDLEVVGLRDIGVTS